MRTRKTFMNFDKAFKIYKVCGKDGVRPEMGYIHFHNGFAYATSGIIAVRIPLSIIAGSLPDYEHLDGKAIHYSAYEKILQYQFAKVETDGILCLSHYGNVLYKFSNNYEGTLTDRIVALFKGYEDAKFNDLKMVGISASELLKLSEAMNCRSNQIVLMFNGPTRAIFARRDEYAVLSEKILGVIMPVSVNY